MIKENDEFEMALQHKFKVHVYNELKRVVGLGFEEYLKYVKGPYSRLLFKFRSGTHGLFEELCWHAKRGGSQECPKCEAYKESVEPVLFDECASYDSQKNIFCIIWSKFLLWRHLKVLITAAFLIKQCMLYVACSLWYNRVGDTFNVSSGLFRTKEILHDNGPTGKFNQNNSTPECDIDGTKCYGG